MATHTAIAATSKGKLEEIRLPAPSPGPGEILLQVKYAALSPADTYQVDSAFLLGDNPWPHVPGLSGSGIVKTVGEGVSGVDEGDKVTCYSFGPSVRRPLQEYCIVPMTLVAKVPDSHPLLEAASIPDNYVTAVYALFSGDNLGLPLPPTNVFPASSAPANADQSILVYGAGSSSGQYTVQMLALAGYSKIIATASSRHHNLLTSFGATTCIDYRSPSLDQTIREAAGGNSVTIAVDCIGARASIEAYAPAVGNGTRVAFLMPIKDGDAVVNEAASAMHVEIPAWARQAMPGAELLPVFTFQHQKDPIARELFMPRILPQLLETHSIKPNPIMLLNERTLLERAEKAFDLFRKNEANGQKIVISVSQ